jgi:hypothetical protein
VIPDEVRKLLGGYATGTLTDEERNLLFSAALQDQELFDALADEEALRELLAEPATRQTLLDQLQRQSVLDASRLSDRQAPLELAAYAASPPPKAAPAETPRWWNRFTPRRLAVAGALAALLLIAGGLQYMRLYPPEPAAIASVNLSMERAPAVRAPDQVPAPRPVPKSVPPAKLPAPKEATPPVADARVSNAAEPAAAIPRNDVNRPAAPADAAPARDQLNQAVRDQIARQPVAQASTAVPATSKGSEQQLAPLTPSQIVTNGLRPASAPPPPPAAMAFGSRFREIDAKVTDINGTIVSIDAGSNAGLKVGNVIEIVRDSRVIATSKLSQVGATFAVGPMQRTAGSADTPQTGDTVRRAR